MAAMGSRHISGVIGLNDMFTRGLGARAYVSPQSSVILSAHSEPEPDIAILIRRPDRYRDHVPTVADVLLIGEMADSSLFYDRETKIGLYARAGIAESWLPALPEDRLYIYRDPSADGYRSTRTLGRGDTVAPLAFPDLVLEVAEMLGRP